MTSRQFPLTVDGLTHASSVMPLDSCNDAEFGTVTTELEPLNCNALPNLPVVAHVVLAAVPLLPLPDASVTEVPDPSSNPYAATKPDGAAGVVRVAVFDGWLVLPA